MSAEGLNARLVTVGELFDDPDATYTVPDYQRNFAWGAEQIEQLISDVHDAMIDSDGNINDDGENGYFLGNLIVVISEGSNVTEYEVIDGQQRLTTLYLLLTFLATDGADRPTTHRGRLRYRSRRKSTEALEQLTSGRSLGPGPRTDLGHNEDQAIHQGFNIISQFVRQLITEPSERTRFAEYLRAHVSLVRAVLPPKTDLNRYFEIMNTRGQQLQQVDIVKARLMSMLDGYVEQSCFAWVWESCADMGSYVQMSLTRGNPALRTRLFGGDWAWSSVDPFAELIAAHSQRDPTTESRAEDVDRPSTSASSNASLTLDEALLHYGRAGVPTSGDDPDDVRFRSTIEFPSFLLHVLNVWADGAGSEQRKPDDDGGLDDKHLIERFAAAFDKNAHDGEALSQRVRDFALLLLRCRNVFDAFVLKRQFTATNGDDGDWSLQRLVKGSGSGTRQQAVRYVNTASRSPASDAEDDGDVDQATNDLLLIQSMLRVTYTSPRTMHWITLVLRTVTSPPSPDAPLALRDRLQQYARQRVRDEFIAGEPARGFDIGRVVFTYLDYLLVSGNGDDPKDARTNPRGSEPFRFTYRNSIEHFYPQHPDEQQTGDVVTADCLNLFGNLALVSVGANSKFSNSLPGVKARNYAGTIELQSPKLRRMAEITRLPPGWGDDQVREHHDQMVGILRRDIGLEDATGSPPSSLTP